MHFIRFLEDQHLAPKRIIWLADEGSLLLLASHEQRITYTKAVFFDGAMRLKTSDKWIAPPQNGKPAFVRGPEEYANNLADHSALLNDLSPTIVSNILGRTELPNIAVFREGMPKAKPNPRNKKNLRRLCADLSQRSIRLDIVMSPMPAQTKELILNAGETAEYLKANLTCAHRFIDRPLVDWGLDQRHFINRRLRDDYPYDMWESFDTFTKSYAGLTERQKKTLYDLNHMNGVGAALFTREMSIAVQ